MTETALTGPSDAELRRRLRRMIELRTTTRAARDLGVSREALLRFLSEVDMREGSRELVRGKLARLAGGAS